VSGIHKNLLNQRAQAKFHGKVALDITSGNPTNEECSAKTMSTSVPQHELDGADLYQVYIHLMLMISCDACGKVLEIEPSFGENGEYSWDWYRIAADQTRRAKWWISPFTQDGAHPMKCLCTACRDKTLSN